MDVSYDIVPTQLVVKALQDSGYRNAAYAIAELIDNSIQAQATLVELFCIEGEQLIQQRQRTRVQQVAVLDNGSGMDAVTLRRALQFGNGTRLGDRSGIGRFGMGLPNSSMSQGSRVEVWTWTDGPDRAMYSYLDLDEIARGDLREVPEPIERSVPQSWQLLSEGLANTGTLVLWPRPDRCTWKTARGIVKNSEEIVGRIYRRFIEDNRVRIRMAAFNQADLNNATIDQYVLPNDPLYLISHTSCPKPFSEEPMFEEWGQRSIRIKHTSGEHNIELRYSFAKKEARQGHNPGDSPHGKHAARNLGVSVVRADRELELDPRWMPSYDPTARWVGVEVSFPPALDEVFGVTNNKQSATHLADIAGNDNQELATKHGYSTYQELKSAWDEEGDPRGPLLEVKGAIDAAIRSMMALLKHQTKGTRTKRHFDSNSPEAVATQATRKRVEEGYRGTSDEQEGQSPEVRKRNLEEGLAASGVPEEEARQIAAQTVHDGIKYVFTHDDTAGGAFFNVRPKGGTLIITLNTGHPAYDNLVGLLEESPDSVSGEDLKERHDRALGGLKLLLSAWARFEDECPDGPPRHFAQQAREDWGRVARQFLMRS